MKHFFCLALLGFGTVFGASLAPAQMIGIQLVGSGNALAPTDSAGVVAQTNYNTLTGIDFSGTTGLVDNTGSGTGAFSVSVAGNNFSDFTKTAYTGTGPNYTLLSGAIGSHSQGLDGGTLTLTLTNIPYAQYDVYIYVDQDGRSRASELTTDASNTAYYYDATSDSGNFNGTFTQVTDTTQTAPTGTTSYPVGEYILLQGLTNSELQVFSYNAPGTAAPDSGNGPAAGISGIQIINDAAVPEPGTWVLMTAGAVGFVVFSLRRARQA